MSKITVKTHEDLQNCLAFVLEAIIKDEVSLGKAQAINTTIRNMTIITGQEIRVQIANGKTPHIPELDSKAFIKQLT